MERLIPKSRNINRQAQAEHRYILFVNHYLKNATARNAVSKAAIAAGYSEKTAHVTGQALIKHPKVRAMIDAAHKRLSERTEISVEKVLMELAKLGFANMQDYIRIQPNGDPSIDLSDLSPEQWAAVSEVVTETYMDGRGDEAREVKRIKIKLHDKLGALEKIAKHLGIFDRHRGGNADDEIEPQTIVYSLKIGNAQFNLHQNEVAQNHLSAPLALPEAGRGNLQPARLSREPGPL